VKRIKPASPRHHQIPLRPHDVFGYVTFKIKTDNIMKLGIVLPLFPVPICRCLIAMVLEAERLGFDFGLELRSLWFGRPSLSRRVVLARTTYYQGGYCDKCRFRTHACH